MSRFVLCRRDVGPIGERDYCSKPINRAHALDWCDSCLSRLPLWPSEEVAHVQA